MSDPAAVTPHTRSVDEDEFPYLSCSANFLQSLNGFSHPSCALKKILVFEARPDRETD